MKRIFRATVVAFIALMAAFAMAGCMGPVPEVVGSWELESTTADNSIRMTDLIDENIQIRPDGTLTMMIKAKGGSASESKTEYGTWELYSDETPDEPAFYRYVTTDGSSGLFCADDKRLYHSSSNGDTVYVYKRV